MSDFDLDFLEEKPFNGDHKFATNSFLSESAETDDFLTSGLEGSLSANGDFNILQYATEESNIKLEPNANIEHIVDELLVENSMTNYGQPQSDFFTTNQSNHPTPMEVLGSTNLDSVPTSQHDQVMGEQIVEETGPAPDVGNINVGQLTVDQLKKILMQTMPATPPPPVQQSSPTVTTLLLNPTSVCQPAVPAPVVNQPTANLVSTRASNLLSTAASPSAISAPSLRQVIQTTKVPNSQSLPAVRVVNPPVTSRPPTVVSPVHSNTDTKVPISRCKGQTKPKERRSSHNVIEKRYRMSINDKIVELKNLVMGQEAKMNKSAVLKKAIEMITSLREQRIRLAKENAVLTAALSKHGVDAKELINTTVGEPLTPSSISDGSHYSPETLMPESPPYSGEDDNQYPASPYTADSVVYQTGMVDGSRIILCMFMFAILFFNPFGKFTGLDGSYGDLRSLDPSSPHMGRTLLKYTDEVSERIGIWNWIIPSTILWSVNLLMMGLVLFKVLVYGEPITTSGSKESTRYWRHINQSNSDLENGFYSSAAVQLKEALHALGRPFPTTRLELLTSLSWQMLRQLLHRAYIGRIFEKMAAWRNKDTAKSSHYAAVAYYRLLQLSLTGKVESSGWQQLNLAVCSLNLAETSASVMAHDMLAEIYATSAVTVLHTLTDHLLFIARFLLSRCRKQCLRHDRDEIPNHLRWLCEPAGHRYLVDLTWYEDLRSLEQGFSSNKHPYNPLSILMQCYRQHLLQIALYEVVDPKPDANIDASLGHLEAIESTNPQEKTTDTPYGLVERVDELSHWWSAMVAVGVHWTKGDYTQAERYYHTLSTLPAAYLQNKDDELSQLPQAIHDIFRARSGLFTRTMCPHAANKLCNKASHLLTEQICSNSLHLSMKVGFQMLACDWLLTTRTELWEQDSESAPGSLSAKDAANGFKSDLNNLQKLSDKHKGMVNKVARYQATYRTMLGCNPSKTNQLLKTSLHSTQPTHNAQHKHPNVSGNHLNTSVMSRSDNKRQLLAEAAQTYELSSETITEY